MDKVEKTAREWFHECLPDGWREEALAALDDKLYVLEVFAGRPHGSLYDAIALGFVWEKTPSGDNEWLIFSQAIRRGKIPPLHPSKRPKNEVKIGRHGLCLCSAADTLCEKTGSMPRCSIDDLKMRGIPFVEVEL